MYLKGVSQPLIVHLIALVRGKQNSQLQLQLSEIEGFLGFLRFQTSNLIFVFWNVYLVKKESFFKAAFSLNHPNMEILCHTFWSHWDGDRICFFHWMFVCTALSHWGWMKQHCPRESRMKTMQKILSLTCKNSSNCNKQSVFKKFLAESTQNWWKLEILEIFLRTPPFFGGWRVADS